MKIEGYQKGKPIAKIRDYYRDDYEMVHDILSCRWSEVVVVGLRRFGKTSLLKRIEGFVERPRGYRDFVEKGLEGWNREFDGNPPRKEFFDVLKTLDARALYISFLESYDEIEEQTVDFFEEISGGTPLKGFKLEKLEESLPKKIFILMDEFSKLAELNDEAEKKREFFLKLHRSAQNLSKRVVFVIAEPPSIFSVFEESIKSDSTIADVTDALQQRTLIYLNGLSPNEKYNLFCLKKTQNYGEDVDPDKISSILMQLSGIPLEIQIAGETFFSYPEKAVADILGDVANAFGGILKKSIISTMNQRQRTLVRLVTEAENNETGLHWNKLKKPSHIIFDSLRDFGLIKTDEDNYVRFTSKPIRLVLCKEVQDLSSIVEDDVYNKELKNLVISEEEKKIISAPEYEPWDGRVRIHHLSDFSLGTLTADFRFNEHNKLDLFALNNKKNSFEAYLKLLKSHSKYRPHILVITGDIAISHHSYCYRGLKEFFMEIMDCINPLPGERAVIPGKQIIVVPGEMDISNPTETPCDGPLENDSIDSCCFSSFFHAFDAYGIPPENAAHNGFDRKISIEIPPTTGISGYHLEILPFNSSTMVWGGSINRRRLNYLSKLNEALCAKNEEAIKNKFNHLLGEEIGFLNMARIEEAAEKPEDVDDTLRIAVTHHNLNPHKARGQATTVDMLNSHEVKTNLLRNHFRIVLHGHQRAPIFVKETSYEIDKKGLKTLFMNGAGKFTETCVNVDDNSFAPSFNSYVIQRIDNIDEEAKRVRGDFKIQSSVFAFDDDTAKFSRAQQMVKEEIFIDEE